MSLTLEGQFAGPHKTPKKRDRRYRNNRQSRKLLPAHKANILVRPGCATQFLYSRAFGAFEPLYRSVLLRRNALIILPKCQARFSDIRVASPMLTARSVIMFITGAI